MAVFNYKGECYFSANGRWLDANSKQISPELTAELNQAFSASDIKQKEKQQRAREEEKKQVSSFFSPSYKNHYHRKATPSKVASQTPRTPVDLTADQRRALSVLESGHNVFLSGEAGTGKSFVLNEYIKRNNSKNVIVCAPTGIAAINIGGSTLHRVFDIPISVTRPGEYNKKPDSAVLKADVIIIDEISMCRFDIFEYVIRTIRQAETIQQKKDSIDAMSNGRMPKLRKQKQIIVVGDFFQLSPVITRMDREIFDTYWEAGSYGEGYAFQSELWNELNFTNVVLREIVRQKGDEDYIRNLNKIRCGDAEGIDWFNENVTKTPIPDSIYLCATNKAADTINFRMAEELEGEEEEYTADVTGEVQNSDKMTQDLLPLKVGMQVMTLINDTEEGYQNGSIGKITALHAKSVEVELNNGKVVTVKSHDWEIFGYEIQEDKLEKVVLGNFKQLPLRIAYAITIHKSQGQTYSSANILPDCFAAGQLYVALSRVQSIDGMSLNHNIRRSALKTARSVKSFYQGLQE